MTLSHWYFFSQSRFGFFLYVAAPFPVLSILTIFSYEYQTKSFEDMKVLSKATFSEALLLVNSLIFSAIFRFRIN